MSHVKLFKMLMCASELAMKNLALGGRCNLQGISLSLKRNSALQNWKQVSEDIESRHLPLEVLKLDGDRSMRSARVSGQRALGMLWLPRQAALCTIDFKVSTDEA